MSRPDWLDKLEQLAARYGHAVGPDLAAMSMAELWGLYQFLRAMAERSA